ncbi:MAG: type II secretion system protein GspL [Magnetococcales bacterium]|nr:type II secretion system protein GspL [Magnetococcales bacterium]
MGERWLIQWPPDAAGHVTWAAPGDGARVARRDSLATVAGLAGRRVVLVVPGEEVLLIRTTPPKGSRNDQLQALPYLLEESLSAPVESLHFAVAPEPGTREMAVAVVAVRLMEEWLEMARTAGVQPEAVIPAPVLVPLERAAWSIALGADQVWVRCRVHAGWATDREHLLFTLRLALEDPAWGERPERLIVWLPPDGDAGLTGLGELGIAVEWRHHAGELLTLLAAHDRPGEAINLAQGRFAPASRVAGWLGAMRPTLLLCGCWLLLRGAEAGLELWRMEQQIVELDQRIEQVFRQAVPEVKRIVNPKVQMSQHLDVMRGAGRSDGARGGLALLGRAGTALQATPEGVLNGLSYGENKLELRVRLPDLQRLDGLKQRLEGSGLRVAIQSASRESDGVAVRLKVEWP